MLESRLQFNFQPNGTKKDYIISGRYVGTRVLERR
jgi:hypothetical protein